MTIPVRQKHSGLGIASFIISMISVAGTIIMLAVATFTGGASDASTNKLVGLMVFLIIFALLVGVGLGIAGIAIGKTKKLFAILGLIFNTVTVFIIAGIIIIGLKATGVI